MCFIIGASATTNLTNDDAIRVVASTFLEFEPVGAIVASLLQLRNKWRTCLQNFMFHVNRNFMRLSA